MSTSPKIVAYRLTPNGIEAQSRDSAIAEFKATARANLISPLLTLDAAEQRKRAEAQAEAWEKLQGARFYGCRDAFELPADRATDYNYERRSRRFSITRDMITGPQQAVNFVDASRFGTPVQHNTVGHDRQLFLREASFLHAAGIVRDAMPDWDSDESVLSYFEHVHTCALEEARSRRGATNRVVDSAPGIFLFAEMLRQTGRIVEEDFNKLWARSIFSIQNLNTWLPHWVWYREDSRASFPQPIDIEQLPSNAPRGSENRAAIPRPLLYWQHAASWTNLELARAAEIVANGGPQMALDQKRINKAVHMCNWYEDLLCFHGNADLDIYGLLSAEAVTGIERVPSGGGFGSGDEEADRQLLTRETRAIIGNLQQAHSPDTILLSTEPWLYVSDKRYGDITNPSGQTVLEAAEQTLRKWGIKDIMWVPEVGYNAGEKLRLQQHGMDATNAERLAGGLDGKQCMVTMNRSADVCEMIVAKERVMYPGREERHDRVEMRMIQGSGGLVFYRPEAIKITTDVGPVP